MNVPVTFEADWARLWQLAERVARGTQEEEEEAKYVFMPVGLALEDPSAARAWDYDSTPINVITFASTGGDGVHFSVVDSYEPNDPRPVVMTVPMAFSNPNVIVGADLREFLGLGCRIGYFSLERLAYNWGRVPTIARVEQGSQPDDTSRAALLRHLHDTFDLQSWHNVEQRLNELDATYRPRLQLRSRA